MVVNPDSLWTEPFTQMADIIERDAHLIVERWAEWLQGGYGEDPPGHYNEFKNSVPDLLREIGRTLSSTDDQRSPAHWPIAIAHGKQRWDVGWDVRHVVSDFQLLRLVVLDHLQMVLDRPMFIREVMALDTLIDQAIGASIEAYFRERQRQIEKSDERLVQSLAVMAHELRNQLVPISNAVHILKNELDDVKYSKNAVDVIDRQVDAARNILDYLMDVSRIRRGKVELKKQPLNLTALLQAAVDGIRTDPHAKELDIRLETPAEPVMIQGDRNRLMQVVDNLLTNAVKYNTRGGAIHITQQTTADGVWIRIKDTGIGMDADFLARAFELFEQGDLTQEPSGGLGIGLSIVKSLVELHDGHVTAKSDGPGKGSEFSVWLPRCLEKEQSRPAAVASRNPNDHTLPLRILIVDDNKASADTLALLLQLHGHDVCVAYDGAGAKAVAQNHSPQVVFLDLSLPDTDGFDLARALRHDGSLSKSLFVAFTGHGLDEDHRRSLAAGFDHHLVKPGDPEQIQGLLQEFASTACATM